MADAVEDGVAGLLDGLAGLLQDFGAAGCFGERGLAELANDLLEAGDVETAGAEAAAFHAGQEGLAELLGAGGAYAAGTGFAGTFAEDLGGLTAEALFEDLIDSVVNDAAGVKLSTSAGAGARLDEVEADVVRVGGYFPELF